MRGIHRVVSIPPACIPCSLTSFMIYDAVHAVAVSVPLIPNLTPGCPAETTWKIGMTPYRIYIWGNHCINTSKDMTNQDAEKYDLMHAKSIGWFFAIPCAVIVSTGAFMSFSITSALIRMFVYIPLAMFLFGSIFGLSILANPPILFSVNRKEIGLYSGSSIRNKCILNIPLNKVDTFRIQ